MGLLAWIVVSGAALAASLPVPRWGLELEVPDDEGWSVRDGGESVVITDEGGAGLRLVAVPNSGCGAGAEPDRTAASSRASELADSFASGDGRRDGAPVRGGVDAPDGASDAEEERAEPGVLARVGDAAPKLPGLDPRWVYVGASEGVSTWCRAIGGGTLRLSFVGAGGLGATSVELANVFAEGALSATARPPAVARKPRYSLWPYLTLRQLMPARPTDIPGGRAAIRLDGAWQPGGRDDYGGSLGLAWEAHTLRLVAVGWEAHLAAVPGQATRSSVLAEGRLLAGFGGWPLRWLGGAAYTGIGFDTITIYEQPALTVPAEAVVFLGHSRFGVEVLVRGDLALTSERQGLDVMGPFDGTYARLAAWAGEKRPEEYDYCDYGYRSVWFGTFTQQQYGRQWVGLTAGYGYTALPLR